MPYLQPFSKNFPLLGKSAAVPCLAFQASVAAKVARERRARAEAKESRLHKSAWVRFAVDCQDFCIYIYNFFYICQSERSCVQFTRSDSTFDLPWPAGSARDNGREDYMSLAGFVVQAEGRATTVPICSDRCAQTCKSHFLEFLLSFRIHLTSSHVGWSVFGWRPV